MKKLFLNILLLVLCAVMLFGCAEQTPKSSVPQTAVKGTLAETQGKETDPKETAPTSTASQTVPEVTAPKTEEIFSYRQDPCYLGKEEFNDTFYGLETQMGPDGKHIYAFGEMSGFWAGLSLADINLFGSLFDKTISKSYGLLVDYFGITREEYDTMLNAMLEKLGYVYLDGYYVYTHIWFSEDYEDHPRFLHPDYVPPENPTVRMRPEGDTTHIGLYHTIDTRLIDHVGVEHFHAYKEKFGGTEDFNIIHFADYFDIDKEEYLTIYPEMFKPYNADYIYGDQEMQDLYFRRHDIHK